MSQDSRALTPDEKAAQDRAENRQAAVIFTCIGSIVLVLALLVVLVGPHMLGFIGMVATVLVFAVMLAFTAGS
ncbi:MAG: hypothetical protein Q4G49_06380 [Paracoccus sp. (in: a-proteobacteria)]|nr:hypothetical protein [Paracoccus sp. (in: a-proteobacteria)]